MAVSCSVQLHAAVAVCASAPAANMLARCFSSGACLLCVRLPGGSLLFPGESEPPSPYDSWRSPEAQWRLVRPATDGNRGHAKVILTGCSCTAVHLSWLLTGFDELFKKAACTIFVFGFEKSWSNSCTVRRT